MSHYPYRRRTQPMVEETPEWIAEQAAKAGRSEEEVRREIEKATQRAEEVRSAPRRPPDYELREQEQRRRQEEERRRQEEEARKRAEEERRRQEEERRRAEEERRRREEEERRRMEEEARRRAEEEARRRAEEEAKRRAEEERRAAERAGVVRRQPMVEETPEWIAEQVVKTGKSEEEIRREIERSVQKVEQRAEEARREEERIGAPKAEIREVPKEERRVEVPQTVSVDKLAELAAESMRKVAERMATALASGDPQKLATVLKELGVDKLPAGLFNMGSGYVSVDDLPNLVRQGRADLDYLRMYFEGRLSVYGERFSWVELALRRLRELGAEIEIGRDEITGAPVYTVKMGGAYIKIREVAGSPQLAGGGYTKEYIEAVSSAIKNAIEAGDVEGLERILKSLPPGVSTQGDLLKTAAEFYRDYVNKIKQLQQIIADKDAPIERKIEAARQMEALLREAAEKYGKAGAPSEDLYRLYQSFASFATNALENIRKFRESAEFAKAVADVFKGRERVDVVEAMSKLAGLTPPGGSATELRDEASNMSVVVTGGGYAVLKIGGVPVFAVDKEGRVWHVDKSGAVLNIELPKDATGLVADLVKRGASPQDAYSAVRALAELKTAAESGQVSGSPFAELARLAGRYGSIDLGEVKVLNEGG
ncbi:MAG: hypothetical protein ACPL3C_07510, partial [Pyrobaculum sp.]